MKNSNIIIRVTEEEKEKAHQVVGALGEKNISSLFRNYINSAYECLIAAPTDKTSLKFYIARLIDEMNSKENLSAWERYNYNSKINMLRDLERKYNNSSL